MNPLPHIARLSGLFTAVLTLLLMPHFARSQEQDGPDARALFEKTARSILQSDDFELLEQTAEDLRTNKAKFPEGLWKLASFYEGLDPEDAKNETDWTAFFAKMEAWKKAYPQSITQPVAHARALTSHAWKARGSGYASTITEEGGKQFDQRLAQARQVLDEGGKLPKKCPGWFNAMQTIALGQGWSPEEYERLFQQAVKLEPTYYDYYFGKATYLLPRWHGEPGNVERFAEEAAKKHDPAEGDSVYTRIAWSLSSYYTNIFHETQFKWDRVKQGFLDIEKSYPDSNWNLNNFGKFAWLAADRETVHSLLERIGDRISLKAWDDPGKFELARVWANPATPKDHLTPRSVLQHSKGNAVWNIAYSPDGKALAAGYDEGEIILWDVEKREPSILADGGQPVAALVFSQDGKMLAAGLGGNESRNVSPGLVRVWEWPGKREIGTVRDLKMPVYDVAFTPDGKQLAVVGGQYNGHAEGVLWDVTTKKNTVMPWAAPHTHHLNSVAISPDGKTLVADCNRSLTVWDLVERKPPPGSKQTLKQWVREVAFSPDGKTLAGAGGGRSNSPGIVVLWDTATWQELKPGITTAIGPANCVAFSPDGKFLAAGSVDTGVRLWRTGSWELAATFIRHDASVLSVAFSPDGKTLASASYDGAIKLWNVPAE